MKIIGVICNTKGLALNKKMKFPHLKFNPKAILPHINNKTIAEEPRL